jgi:hypothetical protein
VVAVLLAPDAAASTATIAKATGTANCRISSGTGTLSPVLTSAGSANTHTMRISFKATLDAGCSSSSVTSPSGVTVTGGAVSGVGTYRGAPANSCADFDGSDSVGRLTVTILWVTSGAPIANTKIVYKGNTGTVSGTTADTIALTAPPGTVTVSGSFSSPSSSATVSLTTTIASPPCSTGVSTFSVSKGKVAV